MKNYRIVARATSLFGAWALVVPLSVGGGAVDAQTQPVVVVPPLAQTPVQAPPPAAPYAPPMAPPPVVARMVRIPEGTEVHVHLQEALSSATATAGDTFPIVSDEEFRLPDGTVIPAGYSGKGEVMQAEKSGMLGKPGQLSIRINYLKIGDTHVHLRANKSSEGKSNVTTMVVTTVLLTGFGLFIHGHSMVFPKGQPLTAYVDEDTPISLPIAPPPHFD